MHLGLIFDECLSGKEHIENVIKLLGKIAKSYKVVRSHVEKDKGPSKNVNIFTSVQTVR